MAEPAAPSASDELTCQRRWAEEREVFYEENTRDHFMDVHTRATLLKCVANCEDRSVFVDVGCSSGYLVEDLRAAHPSAVVVGVDVAAAGLSRARQNMPGVPLARADCTALPLADASVGVVVSANVLEHVVDDLGALREFHRVLRPQGLAAVVVPAGPGLFDAYDEYLGHERRYRRPELIERGKAAGFKVVSSAFLGSLVYPPFWVVKKRNRREAARLDDVRRRELVECNISQTLNLRPGAWACAIERRLLERKVRLPFGIRLLCVFRRPT